MRSFLKIQVLYKENAELFIEKVLSIRPMYILFYLDLNSNSSKISSVSLF